MRRDLLPEEAKAYVDAVNDALLADNTPKAEQLARAFQDRAAARDRSGFRRRQ